METDALARHVGKEEDMSKPALTLLSLPTEILLHVSPV